MRSSNLTSETIANLESCKSAPRWFEEAWAQLLISETALDKTAVAHLSTAKDSTVSPDSKTCLLTAEVKAMYSAMACGDTDQLHRNSSDTDCDCEAGQLFWL